MKLNHSDLYADRDSGPERAHLFNGDKASERNTPLSLFPALPRSSALIPPIDLRRRRRRKKAKSASAAAEAFSHAAKGREGVSE